MTDENENDTLLAIADEAVADLLATSDADLRREMIEDGQDPAELTAHLRSVVRSTVAEHRRRSMVASRKLLDAQRESERRGDKARPPFSEMKQQVLGILLQQEPGSELAVAFREGRELDDEDIASAWEDLRDLGLVTDDE